MDTASSENGEPSATADETRSVTLPASPVEQVETRLAYTCYDTPDEYVAFVPEGTLVRVAAGADGTPDAVDESEVRDRLESPGSLDS